MLGTLDYFDKLKTFGAGRAVSAHDWHDQLLLKLYREGKTIEQLTELMKRNSGSIRSRIKKLTSE